MNIALDLMNRLFKQRKEVINHFQNVIIVSTGITLDISREGRITRKKAATLRDRNILLDKLEN